MMTSETIVLNGCAPTPLVSYLKALGVLRLISSCDNSVSGKAADSNARGWWECERFYLNTALTCNDVLSFFLENYSPSSIIGPWNGRAGFLEGVEQEKSGRNGAKLMRKFGESSATRFANMRRTIEILSKNDEITNLNQLRATKKDIEKKLKLAHGQDRECLLNERKKIEKQEKQNKQSLLVALRSGAKPDHLSYIDACYVLSYEESTMPLLGSGGNDGSRDFGVNFADALDQLFNIDEGCVKDFLTESSLKGALFGGGRLRNCETIGQFSPGQGGYSATTGFEGKSPLNPWDVVLALEGTIVFSGAITRRWESDDYNRASFPFTFELMCSAAGNLSTEDPNPSRGEIWVPLWDKPVTFVEIASIFSEGRLTVGRRTARTGLDAARAVSQIGLARGISSFERYSLIQPDAKKPYQAIPLGRFSTPSYPHRDLIVDLESGGWLEQMRRQTRDKVKFPNSARHMMRRLEDSLFLMTDSNRAQEGTRNAIMAIGSLVDWLTTNNEALKSLSPPPKLSQSWIKLADDGTSEFRVAVALASLGLPPLSSKGNQYQHEDEKLPDIKSISQDETHRVVSQNPIASYIPMAAHFAPIDEDNFIVNSKLQRYREWAKFSVRTVVWGSGNLVSNMIAVLERRMVEASIRSLSDKPLEGAAEVHISDITAFLGSNFDDLKCAALLSGLIWAQPTWLTHWPKNDGLSTKQPPFAYAALKPLFTAIADLHQIGVISKDTQLPTPPGLLVHLRTGGGSRNGQVINKAVRIALNRARGSGLNSPFGIMSTYSRKTSRIGVGIRADRLAASLLIPIGKQNLKAQIARVWPDSQLDDNYHMEELIDAT